MSVEIFEVKWGPGLVDALSKWLVERGQLPGVTAAEMATPELVEMAVSRRQQQVRDAVRSLRGVLESHAVPALDLEVLNMVPSVKVARVVNAVKVPPAAETGEVRP